MGARDFWHDNDKDLKDTSYAIGKKQQNLQLLNILACNSANKLLLYINRVIDRNIQKLQILLVFGCCIASILKVCFLVTRVI